MQGPNPMAFLDRGRFSQIGRSGFYVDRRGESRPAIQLTRKVELIHPSHKIKDDCSWDGKHDADFNHGRNPLHWGLPDKNSG